MEERPTQKIGVFDDVIRWALVSAVALLPLIMSPLNYDVFDLPKATFLYLVTLVAALGYLGRSLYAGELVIRKSPLNKPLAMFATVTVVATVASPVPLVSMLGEYARYENLPTLLSYVLLAFLAIQFMDKKEWLQRLVVASFISFGAIGLYGILQALGADILPPFIREFEGRSRSTLGNPVMFGGYIAIMAPLLLHYLMDEERLPGMPKPAIGMLLVIGLAGAILSQSRGAWLAILVGVAAVLVLHRARLVKGIGTFVAITVFAIAFMLLILSLGGQEHAARQLLSLKDRATTATDLSTGSLASRTEIWKSSLEMISVRPLVGYGPDQMYLWSPGFTTMRKAQLEKNTVPDRAHNDLLQVAINGGLLNLLAFLWAIIALIAVSIRVRRNSTDLTGYAVGVTAALVGYLAQGLSGIAVIGLSAPAFILAGTLAGIDADRRSESVSLALPRRRSMEILAVASLLAAAAAIFAIRPLIADAYYFNGVINQLSNRSDQAVVSFHKAVSLNPYQAQYRKDLALAYLEQGNAQSNANLVSEAVTIIEDGLRYNPHDHDLILGIASAYRVYAMITNDMGLVSQAETYYALAIQKNPLSTNPRRGLLGLLMPQEKYDEAIEQANAILQIDPGDAEVKYRLAQAYEKTGRAGRAKRIYKELLAKYPNRSDIAAALAQYEQSPAQE